MERSYRKAINAPKQFYTEETTMSNELTVIQAVTNVGQALMSMALSTKSLRALRKQDAVILEEKLRYLRHLCRTQGLGEITRASLNEMEKTLNDIQQRNFTGDTLNMAMSMLNLQYQMLCKIIRDYLPN